MRTALDTNVLLELLSQETVTTAISAQLANCKRDGPLGISAVVYAELLAHPQMTELLLAYLLSKTGIEVDYELSETIWKVAACATRGTPVAVEQPRQRTNAVSRRLHHRRTRAPSGGSPHDLRHGFVSKRLPRAPATRRTCLASPEPPPPPFPRVIPIN